MLDLIPEDRDYRHYLGREFIKAIESVECFRNSATSLLPITTFNRVLFVIIASSLLLFQPIYISSEGCRRPQEKEQEHSQRQVSRYFSCFKSTLPTAIKMVIDGSASSSGYFIIQNKSTPLCIIIQQKIKTKKHTSQKNF